MGETDDHNATPPAAEATEAAVKVSVCDADPPWSEYLGRHPQATLFHNPRWGVVMERAYGNRPYYLTARRGDAVVGVLPLVLQRSVLFGTHLCSIPYFDAAGILADDAEAARALTEEAGGLMEQTRAGWVELRYADPVADSLPSRTDKVTLRLRLPRDPDELWKGFDAKVRNQIRKGEREGITVDQGEAELADAFCRVYVRTMRDLGSPPHSLRFFRLVVEHFAAASRLFVARLGQEIVAASFTLTDAVATRVPWAASDWRFRSSNANMLIYWHMLKSACERGSNCFDFGRSTRDSGTYRFKRQWGAEEVPLHWHYVLPPGAAVPDVRPDSPKYRLAVAVWRRLPLGVVRALGPRLIAKLS